MRRFFLAFLLVAGCQGLSGAALAGDVFAITGVRIEAYGSNLSAARQKAIRAGTVEAAYQLLDRLTLPEDRLALDPPLEITGTMAEDLVANIEISGEKRSTSRYLARLGVSFDSELVRNFLRARHLPFVETQASPVLLAPLWPADAKENGAEQPARLPEESLAEESLAEESLAENPLAGVLKAPVFQNQLVPFRLAAIGADEAAALNRLDTQAIAMLAQRSGLGDMLVAKARDTGPGVARIKVYRIHIGEDGIESVVDMGSFEGQAPAGTRPDLARAPALRDAALKIADSLQTSWKQIAMVRGDQRQSVHLTALYDSLAGWQRLRTALAGASLVEETRLDALAMDGALLTLTYTGTEEQLARLLAQQGVLLRHEDIGLTARLR